MSRLPRCLTHIHIISYSHTYVITLPRPHVTAQINSRRETLKLHRTAKLRRPRKPEAHLGSGTWFLLATSRISPSEPNAVARPRMGDSGPPQNNSPFLPGSAGCPRMTGDMSSGADRRPMTVLPDVGPAGVGDPPLPPPQGSVCAVPHDGQPLAVSHDGPPPAVPHDGKPPAVSHDGSPPAVPWW